MKLFKRTSSTFAAILMVVGLSTFTSGGFIQASAMTHEAMATHHSTEQFECVTSHQVAASPSSERLRLTDERHDDQPELEGPTWPAKVTVASSHDKKSPRPLIQQSSFRPPDKLVWVATYRI